MTQTETLRPEFPEPMSRLHCQDWAGGRLLLRVQPLSDSVLSECRYSDWRLLSSTADFVGSGISFLPTREA